MAMRRMMMMIIIRAASRPDQWQPCLYVLLCPNLAALHTALWSYLQCTFCTIRAESGIQNDVQCIAHCLPPLCGSGLERCQRPPCLWCSEDTFQCTCIYEWAYTWEDMFCLDILKLMLEMHLHKWAYTWEYIFCLLMLGQKYWCWRCTCILWAYTLEDIFCLVNFDKIYR